MFTSRTLLFLTFLAALFVATTYAQDACSTFRNCDSCILQATCGWCETTDECLTGNVIGPGGSALNCSEWSWDTCITVDCFRFSSCSACLRDPFCGWCQATTTCVEGVSSGPVTGTCSNYIFDRSNCPATSTTGRRTVTTTGRRTVSTTGGRRTVSTTGGRRTVSTTGGTVSTSGGRRTVSTSGGRRTVSTSGTASTSGGRRTTGGSTSGRRTTGGSTSGRRTTGGSTSGRRTTGGSTSGRRTTGGSTSGSPPAPAPAPASTTGRSTSAAFSVSPSAIVVAFGVILVALLNLLW